VLQAREQARASLERVRKRRQREQERGLAATAEAVALAAEASGKGGGGKKKGSAAAAAAAKKWDGSALSKQVSKDSDVVLAGVMRLQREMKADLSPASSSSSAAATAGGSGVPAHHRLTLADLAIEGVKADVRSLSDEEVRAQIERVTLACVNSILSGEGFHYEVPQRSGTNQLYVPELDRIVLKDKTVRREFTALSKNHKAANKATIMCRVLGLIYEICVKHIHVTKRDLF